jgi:hypothetical protein
VSLHRYLSFRPNPYVDDSRGKIVISSWNLVARKEKSGKRGISSRLVEGKKFLEPFSVTFEGQMKR